MQTERPLRRLRRRIAKARCCWFGCNAHPQDPSPPDHLECMHCGDCVSYGDMVGDTRHYRFTEGARYWLWRRWVPAKCTYCGHRWSACDNAIDHIPF